MGFFYSNNNGNKVFGYKFTIKFGKGSPAENAAERLAESVLKCLDQFGVTIKTPFDNDVNKDKRIL